jgi:hypothetical protein
MHKLFKNDLRFKLEPVVDENAIKKQLKRLQDRNDRRRNILNLKRYKPIVIQHGPQNKFLYPEGFLNKVSNNGEQRDELLRIAKIIAFKTRETHGTGDKYELAKDNFFRDYSSKISKLNLYTQLNTIFRDYMDMNYKEPMFDKDYLKQGTSDNYIKELDNKLSSERILKEFLESSGKAGTFTDSADPRDIVGGRKIKHFDDLGITVTISKYKEGVIVLTKQKNDIDDLIRELVEEKEKLRTGGALDIDTTDLDKKIEDNLKISNQIGYRIGEYQRKLASTMEIKNEKEVLKKANEEALKVHETYKKQYNDMDDKILKNKKDIIKLETDVQRMIEAYPDKRMKGYKDSIPRIVEFKKNIKFFENENIQLNKKKILLIDVMRDAGVDISTISGIGGAGAGSTAS